MSLLDKGDRVVIVFPAESWVSPDGNPVSRASAVGISTRGTLQLRQDQATDETDRGYVAETVWRLRLVNRYAGPRVDPGSLIEVPDTSAAVTDVPARVFSVVSSELVGAHRRTRRTELVLRRVR